MTRKDVIAIGHAIADALAAISNDADAAAARGEICRGDVDVGFSAIEAVVHRLAKTIANTELRAEFVCELVDVIKMLRDDFEQGQAFARGVAKSLEPTVPDVGNA